MCFRREMRGGVGGRAGVVGWFGQVGRSGGWVAGGELWWAGGRRLPSGLPHCRATRHWLAAADGGSADAFHPLASCSAPLSGG